MNCFVYKGALKPDCYLYLPERDRFGSVPDGLMEQLGTLELVLTFDLYPNRKLAQEDARNVLDSLEKHGFHLQMPPPPEDPLH